MLDIRLNNESFDLSGKERISFTEKNNLFDNELVQVGYALPFTLPSTEKNRRMLGFVNDPNSLTEFESEYNVEIFLSSLPFRKASLFVSSASDKSISCKLIFGNRAVVNYINNTNISDLDLGFTKVPKPNTHFVPFRISYTGLPEDLELNIYRNVSGSPVTVYYQALWQGTPWDTAMEMLRLINGGLGLGGDDGKNKAIVFDLGVSNVYYMMIWVDPYNLNDDYRSNAVDSAGLALWNVTGRDLTWSTGPMTGGNFSAPHYYFSSYMLSSLYASDKSGFSHIFAPIRAEKFTTNDINNWWNFINSFDYNPGNPVVPSGFHDNFDFNQGFTLGNTYHIAPLFYLYKVIIKAFENIGWSIGGDFFNDSEILTLLIFSNKTVDYKLLNTNTTPPTEFDYHTIENIYWGNLAPDITISQVLTALKLTFGLYIDFDSISNIISLSFSQPIIEDGTIVDLTPSISELTNVSQGEKGFTFKYRWDRNDGTLSEYLNDTKGKTIIPSVFAKTSLPTIGIEDNALCLVESENKIYTWTIDHVGNYSWLFWGDNMNDYSVGDGSKAIEIPMSPLLSYSGVHKDGSQSSWPSDWLVSQIGVLAKTTNLKWGSRNESTDLHLSFYRGMWPKSTGRLYPLVMYHNLSFGINLTGNYSLAFDGLSGTWEKFLKPLYTQMMGAKIIKAKGRLNSAQLFGLNFKTKYKVMNQLYYIVSYSPSLSVDRDIHEVEFTLMVVK